MHEQLFKEYSKQLQQRKANTGIPTTKNLCIEKENLRIRRRIWKLTDGNSGTLRFRAQKAVAAANGNETYGSRQLTEVLFEEWRQCSARVSYENG